jgi:CCR4-NOT transcription complex subunit 1
LAQVLESKQFQFAIELAALASRREYLNLDKWLQDRLSVDGEPFLRACLEFLNEKVINAQNGRLDGLPTVPLSLEVTTTFLRILHNNSGYFRLFHFMNFNFA